MATYTVEVVCRSCQGNGWRGCECDGEPYSQVHGVEAGSREDAIAKIGVSEFSWTYAHEAWEEE
jgi:hypothetical protein